MTIEETKTNLLNAIEVSIRSLQADAAKNYARAYAAIVGAECNERMTDADLEHFERPPTGIAH